jgi:hypothetical protein
VNDPHDQVGDEMPMAEAPAPGLSQHERYGRPLLPPSSSGRPQPCPDVDNRGELVLARFLQVAGNRTIKMPFLETRPTSVMSPTGCRC